MVQIRPLHDDHEEQAAAQARRWFSIARAVWLDQRAFWRHFRPQVAGRRRGWRLLLSAAGQATLLAFLLSAPVVGVLALSGKEVDWRTFGQGALVGWSAGILFTLLSILFADLATGIVHALLFLPLLMPIGILAFTIEREIAIPTGLILMDVALGIDRGILTGKNPDLSLSLGFGLATIFVIYQAEASGAILAGILAGFILYFSQLWATRQEPDARVRQRLARPPRTTPTQKQPKQTA